MMYLYVLCVTDSKHVEEQLGGQVGDEAQTGLHEVNVGH